MTQLTTTLLSTVAVAALASIALPAFAQEAPATPDQPAIVTPPPVVEAPAAAPAIQPSVAAPVVQPNTSASQVAAQAAPAPSLTLPVPKLDPTPRQSGASAPAKVKTMTADKAAVSSRTTTTQPAEPATATTVSPSTTSETAATMTAPAADVAPPATSQSASIDPLQDSTDWTLIAEIAAVGGIAALGLGGLALTRRRRDDTEIAEESVIGRAQATVVPAPEPRFVAPAMAAPRSIEAPMGQPAPVATHRAVAGSGRHVAAALRGPTPENPFLTERARLRRARFLDKREALGASVPLAAAPAPAPVARLANQPAQQTTYVLGKTKPSTFGIGLRPAQT